MLIQHTRMFAQLDIVIDGRQYCMIFMWTLYDFAQFSGHYVLFSLKFHASLMIFQVFKWSGPWCGANCNDFLPCCKILVQESYCALLLLCIACYCKICMILVQCDSSQDVTRVPHNIHTNEWGLRVSSMGRQFGLIHPCHNHLIKASIFKPVPWQSRVVVWANFYCNYFLTKH